MAHTRRTNEREIIIIIIILTLGWVGYGERRYAELPREDVPSQL
jgi:hypothetical protein